MGRSITEGLYTSPLSRTCDRKALSDKEVSKLDDDAVLYSIRGEAPEGWYNAGTRKHASAKVLAMKIIRSLRSCLQTKHLKLLMSL